MVVGLILGNYKITQVRSGVFKMPLAPDTSAPAKFPNPSFLTLDNFKRGVITIVNRSQLPKNALEEARNCFLVEDGQPSIRPGVDWYGAVTPNAASIDGFDYFDAGGVIHIVIVAGGVVYRSLDNGNTWTVCSGASLTIGIQTNMNQNGAFLYLTNGTDTMVRYDGTTTLQTYTSLTTPTAPTAAITGLTGTNFTVYYKIAAVNTVGFSVASTKVTQQVLLQRGSWDATHLVTLTLPSPQVTQTRTDIYYSEDDLTYYYLDSVISSTATPNVTYIDNGTAVLVPNTTAPTANTTLGPRVAELTNVGSRQYGVRDTDNRYRIWFTGTGQFSGAFSGAYDGGYLDWQPGGKYYPVHVEDYRDGKGTPLATIWCDSADGQGCILQMSLDTLTIQDISITVPSAYKLPGSRGTNAPGSVINVLNDYHFYNAQALYNLGSRAQFLNLLSTDEISANIRPTVQQINPAAASGIATAYVDGKVYYSVPRGDVVNNTTDVYDTERKAWIPDAFTMGFKKFLRYTSLESDGSKVNRLLAIKPGDNQLSEINSLIKGDYGVAFESSLQTGLYPVAKNRYEFQSLEEGNCEFTNTQGSPVIELLGIERSNGFKSLVRKPLDVESTISIDGWDKYAWDSIPWDYVPTPPSVFSEPTFKRYFNVQKEVNAVQWRITTSSLDDFYVLRSLQTWGTETQGGHPRRWRL